MKMLISILSFASLNVGALTIDQDQGHLEIQYAKLNRPYEVQLIQPMDCEQGSASMERKETSITVRHRAGCSSGAVCKVLVNEGQDLNALLGAGSLELKNFGQSADQIGVIEASASVGSVAIPEGFEFRKTGMSFVGKSYERNTGRQGAKVELQVKAGAVKVSR